MRRICVHRGRGRGTLDPMLQRPRDMAGVHAALARFRTPESAARAAAFRPRPTDVFICTYPKSGTTWLQQIVHVLRGGDLEFEEICAVVPWLESAHDMGLDLDGPQPGSLRAFKTHLTVPELPPGGRCIYAMRDPKDVAVSFYRFFEGWMFEPGTISLDTFVDELVVGGSRSGRYWDHVCTAWPARARPDVLILAYEDMRADLEGAVRRVARFLGIEDAAAIRRAVACSAFEFMAARPTQFDDHLLRAARDAACELPPGETTKVRAGVVGAHRAALSARTAAKLDAIWAEELAPVLGAASYDALRAALAGG